MSKPRITPAFLVACLALLVALSGIAYAATTLPKNSVGAKQLKKNAVATKKIKANAVTGAKIADGTVTGADVDESTLVMPAAKVQPGTLSFSGTEFKPRGSSVSTTYVAGGAVSVSGGSEFLTLTLPLPQGATITNAKVFLLDATITNNEYVQFVAVPQDGSAFVSLDSVTTGGSNPAIQAYDIAPTGADAVVVDNTKYTYELWYKPLTIDVGLALAGARFSWS